MRLLYILLTASIVFGVPNSALAVLPPDIIFSVGTQLWQIVVGVGALVVGSITAVFPFLRNISSRIPRLRMVILSVGMLSVLGGLFLLFYILFLQ